MSHCREQKQPSTLNLIFFSVGLSRGDRECTRCTERVADGDVGRSRPFSCYLYFRDSDAEFCQTRAGSQWLERRSYQLATALGMTPRSLDTVRISFDPRWYCQKKTRARPLFVLPIFDRNGRTSPSRQQKRSGYAFRSAFL